jgi:hypothetical protein
MEVFPMLAVAKERHQRLILHESPWDPPTFASGSYQG